MRKIKPYLILLSILILLCGLRFYNPWFLDTVRDKALDQHQRSQPIEYIDNIVTVTINNKTINERGQWPWPRDELAAAVNKLYDNGAGLVVLPILLSEPDRSGKDEAFEQMLLQTPTIIAQVPANDFDGSPVTRGVAAVGLPWENWLYRYSGAVGPIQSFSDAAIGVGMLIVSPESDGVVRRAPLAVNINGNIFPSMTMEVLRVAAGDVSYQIKTGAGGVEALRIPKYGKIITDSNGNLFLDYKWRTHTYELDSILPNLDGKIVILSLTASGLDAPVPTPIGVVQNHDIIAGTLATVMDGRVISRPYWSDFAELGASFILALIVSLVVLLFKWYFGVALLGITVYGTYWYSGYLFTNNSYLIDWSYPIFTIFVCWSVAAFLRFMEEYRLKQQIKKQFEHYLAPAMVKKLQKNPDLLKLGGDTRELTLLFCDIRGFTPISEQYKTNPQGLTDLINRFLTPMTDIIMKNDGTIDKYMGDCIMAFWNAPLDVEDQRKKAVQTAHEMLDHLKGLNEILEKENKLPIKIGIGLNTGEVVVGNMGSEQRFDYSCLGDAVNLAARLEGQSKGYGVEIILGEDTAKGLENDYALIELDTIAVKGKEEAVKIFTTLGKASVVNNIMNWMMPADQHVKFLTFYKNKNWVLARKWAEDLKACFNGELEKYYDIMLERINELEKQNLPEKWDGVYRATSK